MLLVYNGMAKKKEVTCDPADGYCYCKGVLAILIIVLVWASAATWSRVIITIAATLVLLGAGGCACKANIKKKK
tara:strand:+ start:481 stop:702 length:222 start_codon:yes stop_codon:yes gene_type:complete